MTCFTGGCAGDQHHSTRHFNVTQHPVVANVKKTRRPAEKVEMGADGGVKSVGDLVAKLGDMGPKYDFTYTARCLKCQVDLSLDANVNPKLAQSVVEVQSRESASTITDTSLGNLDEKPVQCIHTGDKSKNQPGLVQLKDLPDLSNAKLAKCTQCDLHENLWLCLACGALSCPRKYVCIRFTLPIPFLSLSFSRYCSVLITHSH